MNGHRYQGIVLALLVSCVAGPISAAPAALNQDEGYLALVWETSDAIRSVRVNRKGRLAEELLRVDVGVGKTATFTVLEADDYCLRSYYVGRIKWEMSKRDGVCFRVEPGRVNYGGHLRPRNFRSNTDAAYKGGTIYSVNLTLVLHNPADFLAMMDQQPAPEWQVYPARPEMMAEDVARNAAHLTEVGGTLRDNEIYTAAANFLEAGARMGSGEAAFLHGEMERLGEGRKTDETQAVAWYRQAAEAGHPRAQAMLCMALDLGRGVEEDPVAAVPLCRAAAERGDALGQWHLSRLIHRQRGGLQADPAESARLLAAAEGQADVTELARNSYYFRDGKRNFPDGEEAMRIARLMMGRRDDAGAFAAGFYVSRGIGAPQDWKESERLFLLAAQWGDEEGAARRLAQYFRRGENGYPKDARKALHYLERYEKANPQRARNELAWFLATTEDASVRDGKRAVRIMQGILKGDASDSPAQVDTLAAAYAAAGEFKLAVDAQRRAIALLQRRGAEEAQIADYGTRLDLYRREQVYVQVEN